jgi:hypothetical protein
MPSNLLLLNEQESSFLKEIEALFSFISKLLSNDSTNLQKDEFIIDLLFLFIFGLKGHYLISF